VIFPVFSTEFIPLYMAKEKEKGSAPKLCGPSGRLLLCSIYTPCRQCENCNLLFLSFFLCPSDYLCESKLKCVNVGGFAYKGATVDSSTHFTLPEILQSCLSLLWWQCAF